METNPVQPSAPRPDIAPENALNRKPQPLSRNFEQRVNQLAVITENPTGQQVAKLADKIASDHPEDAQRATEMSLNSFKNMSSLIKERADAVAAVKQARKEALAAPSSEFKAKVALLREAEQKRAEVMSSLRSFSNDFQEAGIELDPSQIPLSLGDKLSQKAHEVKDNVAAGVNRAGEGIKGAAGAVKETGVRLMEAGRGGLKKLLEAVTSSLNQAQEAGQAGFNDVKSKAEATSGRAAGGASKLAEMWRNAKEGVSQRVSDVWEAATVWTDQRRQEIAARVGVTQENIGQMLAKARSSAGGRIDGFNQAMQSVGEAARNRWDAVSESVKNFASDQARRVEAVTTQVSTRVRAEVSMAVEKGRIFLEPAWESIQRDRERIRQERDIYGEKMGIMVEGVSDVASPIIDRILDEGRDLRDTALGIGRRQLQGLQVFGRNVAGDAVEVASPAWNFLVERWENLRLRANESRVRLNTFMEAVSGKAGNRFSMLRESLSERAKRTSSVLSGVKFEGGRVLQNGVEVAKQTAEWFAQTGTTAKEFLLRRKEQIGQSIDMLRRYWEVYAVGKWKESGLTDIDIKRRMKLLRATGAASLGRAASIGAAAGIEGAVMLQSLARDRRGRVALTVLALGIAIAVNPELRDGLQNLLSNIDLSGLHLPNFGAHLGGIDTSAVNMPIDLGSISAGTAGIDIGGSVTPPAPDVSVAGGISGGPTHSPDVSTTVAAPVPDITGAVPTPDVVGSLPNLDMLTPGQPLEAQARHLAGGVNETYYNILQGGFDQFKDNFLTTAQAVVNNASNYTPEEVAAAQQQLEAVARLNQDPTLVQGSQGWYDAIMKATHFWRPV